MPLFIKTAIEKIIFAKMPFLGFFLLVTLPVLIPETTNSPIVFWIFYYILWGWFWSWLLASWLSFSFVTSKKINVSIFSGVVGRTFLHQLKLYALMLFTMIIVLVPAMLLLLKPLLGLASPDEIRILQLAFSGRGELVEPGLSFFMRIMFIVGVIPVCIGLIFYMRCGYGMLSLTEGSKKVGLISSWKKSKGTTLLALKLFAPFILGTALLMILGSLMVNSSVILNFFIQAIGTILLVPMFFEALTFYYGQLQSDDEE